MRRVRQNRAATIMIKELLTNNQQLNYNDEKSYHKRSVLGSFGVEWNETTLNA
jgi:hypothetical protein